MYILASLGSSDLSVIYKGIPVTEVPIRKVRSQVSEENNGHFLGKCASNHTVTLFSKR